MNIVLLAKQFWGSVRRFVRFLLVTESFNYVVQMSSQDCLQRLRGLSQPKVGFVNAISQSVELTKEDNHFRFEVCIMRYGRSGEYRSVRATGTVVPAIDKSATTIISGNICFGLHFLATPILFLGSIFFIVFRFDLFRLYFIFYILWFTFMLFYVTRDYGDYHKLDSLIHDTFFEEKKLIDGRA